MVFSNCKDMARRRQEIALQVELETQEEWNEATNKEGLLVVDIYQQWAGPCKSVEGNFKRIKLETGEKLLKFALAKADTIDSLEKYRGRCEPCFLFYASGVLVDAVIGANAPELQRKILLNLEQEKKILKDGGERREFNFDHGATDEEEDGDAAANRQRSSSVAHAISNHHYTLAVIRPDAYADGKVEGIIDQIKANGFKVLIQQEHHLNENEARELHRYKMNQEGYEDHIACMVSGPSIVLILQKNEAKDASVDDFRELVDSDESLKTFVDCTQSIDNLHDELVLLLPNIAQRPHTPQEQLAERTLAIIRPSALKLFKDAIVSRIIEAGFEVTRQTEMHLTREQAEEFYSTKKSESGPSLALYMIKKDAVQGFRTLLGPTEKNKIKEASGTFRHEFDMVDINVNSLHGPRSHAEVNRNVQFFFPEERILAILKPNLTSQQRSDIVDALKKAGFFIMARKMDKLTGDQVAQVEKAHQGKDHYNELLSYLTSGQSELLALAKENASQSLSQILGPEDPTKAKESAPNSLRALYGKDLVHNAIDVSSDAEQGKQDIHLIFGDLERDEA
ncbi:unnamed protein product [Rotaria socialis]|uniref:Nucleoside diphosphate kinase-like domain-containing protein n=1 Tax=Rotaria socialis TaxID=392032 RepID=A0A820G2J6_9BILA|nr:unnamed protein product [Rotaria socialis]